RRNCVDEVKKKFPGYPRGLYSLFLHLFSSDSNKRFVYDVGAYNSDDDKADQNVVGTLIGKGGEIVRNLQLTPRPVEIIGNLASIEKAEKLIHEVIAQVINYLYYQEHADKVESTDSGCPFYL
ncbi:unnamed protein product, partial [Brassica oleracea var. botrytis]